MFVPWFAPFMWGPLVVMAVIDRATGGAFSKVADDYMKRDVEDRFKPREPGHYKSER